ncbi:MAG: CRISPR-associated protein Cas7 [Bacteroidales bacterium]
MNPFIYIRGLRHVDLSVFNVSDGQKTYYDPIFNRYAPFSSGQQVKRSMLDAISNTLNATPSSVIFNFGLNAKGALTEGEALSACDPSYFDQLLGGWMRASKGGMEKTLKRRSPLSISAMTPLHTLLCDTPRENITFDRSDKPHLHKVVVRDASGNKMDEAQIASLLEGTDRSLYRKWIPENKRATGLFTYDMAIDLRTLFAVSINQLEPEISADTIKKLEEEGWVKGKNVFGDCLIMPKEKREKLIPALANAIINWRITSNQARTFSLMETLAIAVSDQANTLSGAIRAKLVNDESGKERAKPIVDEGAGAKLFVMPACGGYMITTNETPKALEEAEQELIRRMSEFDYENQN